MYCSLANMNKRLESVTGRKALSVALWVKQPIGDFALLRSVL